MKGDIRTNRFLKCFCVLLLCVFVAISCFYGGVTVIRTSLGTDNYFESDACGNQMSNHVREIWNEALYSTDALDTLVENLNENYDYSLQKYDAKTDSYIQVKDFTSSRDYYGRILEYGVNQNKDSLWEIHEDNLEQATYRLEVGLKWNLVNDGSILYRQYCLSEFAKEYEDNSLIICVGSTVCVLLLLLYEIVSAGHVKGKEDIQISWFDKIPFDVLSIVWFMIGTVVVSVLYENTYYGFSEFSVVETVFVPVFCTVLFALFVYVYLISFVVRVKSHTLLQNTVLSIVLTKVVRKLYFCAKVLKRIFHSSSTGWKRIVLLFFICVFIHTCFTIHWMNEIYASGLVKIVVYFLLCIEVAGSFLLFKINADSKPLLNAAENFAKGNLEYRISEDEMSRMHGPFFQHAQNLNLIGEGMKKAIQNELKSERMKAELITNVSHDIKTPLTSIVNYVDLLSKEHTEEQEKQYLAVLQRQSQRLKRLTEDVVEASKASSGAIDVHMENVSVKEILEQTLAEYEDKLEEHYLVVVTNYYDENIFVNADGRLLWRVLRNVFSNVAKYAMDHSRVYVDARLNGNNEVVITVKNISREQLNMNEDELMQRFVRGDVSRHTEGSGLGLSIAKSLTELMHGEFKVLIDGDLFKTEVILKEANRK